MNRTAFEALRNLPSKRIVGTIEFVVKRQLSPVLFAENIPIENAMGLDVRLAIHLNPEVGSVTFNVYAPAEGGPICRLDVDGPPHKPCGRSHKHSLQTERCPGRNLPDGVVDRPELSRKSLIDLFDIFCRDANIVFEGTLVDPTQGLPV